MDLNTKYDSYEINKVKYVCFFGSSTHWPFPEVPFFSWKIASTSGKKNREHNESMITFFLNEKRMDSVWPLEYFQDYRTTSERPVWQPLHHSWLEFFADKDKTMRNTIQQYLCS